MLVAQEIEEIKNMDVENITNLVEEKLRYNAYETQEKERVIYSFYSNGLYLNKVCYVKDNPSSSIIRVMMSFSHNACNSPLEEHLTIREDEKNWSEDYKKLTRDFHPQL